MYFHMQDGNLKYSLYAVLVHSGWSTHSGHYYCFVRTATDMWHVLDDSRVLNVYVLSNAFFVVVFALL